MEDLGLILYGRVSLLEKYMGAPGAPPPAPPAQKFGQGGPHIGMGGPGGPSTGRMGGGLGGLSLENEGGLGGPRWKGLY